MIEEMFLSCKSYSGIHLHYADKYFMYSYEQKETNDHRTTKYILNTKLKLYHTVIKNRHTSFCAKLQLIIGKRSYSRISISWTRISRILRDSTRLSESKIHFDCFLQPVETFLQVQITRSANEFALLIIWTCKK